MPDGKRKRRKHRLPPVRWFHSVRDYNSRLKPPFRQIAHSILYVLAALVTLLLIALIFFPALQVIIAGSFSALMSLFFSPAFMMTWLPVRVGRKLVSFSLARLFKRTRYYQMLRDRVQDTIFFPKTGPADTGESAEEMAQ